MEIQDLKVQLSHSISREEVEVLRRELQKSEKQRGQLAEHIEVSAELFIVTYYSIEILTETTEGYTELFIVTYYIIEILTETILV